MALSPGTATRFLSVLPKRTEPTKTPTRTSTIQIQFITMKINTLAADPFLRAYISRYWLWENEQALPTMLPGTGAELIFQYNGSPITIESARQHTATTLANGILLQPRHDQFSLKAIDKVSFISVRFRHGALRHFCEQPVAELINQPISVKELWGNRGETLASQIVEAKTLPERITLLAQFLRRQWQQQHKTQYPWFEQAITCLYYQQEPDLNQIIQHSNVSPRYFQKIFKMNCGVSPKHFQCTARFEKTLRHLLLTENPHYLLTALEQGYYDQAHFIKNFRQFTQSKPRDYLQEKNFRTHFYNPSLASSLTMPFSTQHH